MNLTNPRKDGVRATTVLRGLLARGTTIPLPLIELPLYAKFCEAAGFEAVYLSGDSLSASMLGLPDAGFTTLTEVAQVAGNMAAAVNIPVIVDADTGWGNAIGVRRTVQTLIRAGAAALQLEDQVSPKRCGFVRGKEVLPLEEAVGKIRSAADARDELDRDFVIIARTDIRTAVGGTFEQSVERANAYLAAGADVVFCEALASLEELEAALKRINGPVLGWSYDQSLERLSKAGLRLTLLPGVTRAARAAAWDFARELHARGPQAWTDYQKRAENHPLSGFRYFDFLGFPEIRAMEERYLPAADLERKYAASSGEYEPETNAAPRPAGN